MLKCVVIRGLHLVKSARERLLGAMNEGLSGVCGNKGTWQQMVQEHGNNLNFPLGTWEHYY